MALLLGTAVTRVREQVNEKRTAQWSDLELRRWIVDASKDISRRAKCLRGSSTFSTVAGTDTYSISTRLIEITHVDYLRSGWSYAVPLSYVDVHTKASFGYTASTYPNFYTLWGHPPSLSMILYPTPNVTSDTVTYWYYRLPAALALDGSEDDQTVEIPEGWEDLIYLYAEYSARRRDNQSEYWIPAKQLYEDTLAELIRSARYTRQTGQIFDDWNPTEYYFGPYGRGR